ncbi:MAG: hypothetical protein K9G64_04155 [Bacteroidia bacterium]|nr:hypothetical protein [Bacteroidia bacterium]
MKSVFPIKYFVLLIGVIITLWPALYNHYALFFTDSQLYINYGNEFSFSEDRSFVYGWFIGITSLHISLWFPIIIQAIIFNFVCFNFVEKLALNFTTKIYLPIILLLSAFTSLAWDVSYLMPDVFSPISILVLYLLFTHSKPFGTQWILLVLAYLLILQTHFAFMLFHCLVLAIILLLQAIKLPFLKSLNKTMVYILTAAVFINIGLFTLEKKALGANEFSSVSHVFLMGKLVENGVLQKYLDQECLIQNFEICAFKNNLAPQNYSGNFLFSSESAFQRTGGWANPHEEYKTIIKNILTTPKYLWLYVKAVFKETFLLFGRNEIGSSIHAYPRDGWGPHPAVVKYYPNEIPVYDLAKQNAKTLQFPFKTITIASIFLLIISFVIAIFHFKKQPFVVFFILLTLVSNAIITGGLVGLEDRYCTRQNWLIILLALIFMANNIYKKQRTDLPV